MESLTMTIQMKAIEQYFHSLLSIFCQNKFAMFEHYSIPALWVTRHPPLLLVV